MKCRNMIAAAFIAVLSAGYLVGFTGCTNQHPTYPVQGRVVTSDGRPLQTGRVEFRSIDTGMRAQGEIDREGNFTLSTYQQGDGAVAGRHEVVIVQLIIAEMHRGGHLHDHGPTIAPRYYSYDTSGLAAEVTRGQTNEVTLVVEPNQ